MAKRPERPTPIRIDLRGSRAPTDRTRGPGGAPTRHTRGLMQRVRAYLARLRSRLPWRSGAATEPARRVLHGAARVRLPTRGAEAPARRLLTGSRLRVAPLAALRARATTVGHALRLALPKPLRALPGAVARPFARVPRVLRAHLMPRGTVDLGRVLLVVILAVGLGALLLALHGLRAEAAWRSEAFGGPQYVFVGDAELDRLRSIETVVNERFIWPIATVGRVTSCFGPRNLVGALAHHQGLDVAAPQGTPVVASKTGVVKHYLISSAPTGYGTRVLLEHPDGMHTLYAHLQPRLDLVIGQTVSQGAVVGYSGNTGFSTGPHLHFEILDGHGRALDPARHVHARRDAPIFLEADHTCWPTGVLAWRR